MEELVISHFETPSYNNELKVTSRCYLRLLLYTLKPTSINIHQEFLLHTEEKKFNDSKLLYYNLAVCLTIFDKKATKKTFQSFIQVLDVVTMTLSIEVINLIINVTFFYNSKYNQ